MKRIPEPGEQHVTASAFLITTELPRRVLMLHHKKVGKWIVPGGHVDHGENPYDAVMREVREETGIEVSDFLTKPIPSQDGYATFLPLPRYLLEENVEAHGDQPAHQHLDHVYVIEVPFADAVHDPNESHDIRWFTYEETFLIDTFADIRVSLKELLT